MQHLASVSLLRITYAQPSTRDRDRLIRYEGEATWRARGSVASTDDGPQTQRMQTAQTARIPDGDTRGLHHPGQQQGPVR